MYKGIDCVMSLGSPIEDGELINWPSKLLSISPTGQIFKQFHVDDKVKRSVQIKLALKFHIKIT